MFVIKAGSSWVAGYLDSDGKYKCPAIVSIWEEHEEWSTVEKARKDVEGSCSLGLFEIIDLDTNQVVLSLRRITDGGTHAITY